MMGSDIESDIDLVTVTYVIKPYYWSIGLDREKSIG
jgi:hypothetical protein